MFCFFSYVFLLCLVANPLSPFFFFIINIIIFVIYFEFLDLSSNHVITVLDVFRYPRSPLILIALDGFRYDYMETFQKEYLPNLHVLGKLVTTLYSSYLVRRGIKSGGLIRILMLPNEN